MLVWNLPIVDKRVEEGSKLRKLRKFCIFIFIKDMSIIILSKLYCNYIDLYMRQIEVNVIYNKNYFNFD